MVESSPFFANAAQFPNGEGSSVAVRQFGVGPPVVFIHGFPLHGATFRHLLSRPAERNTCVVVDLLGAGDSRWRLDDDFSFESQALRVSHALDAIGVGSYSVVAHDSGATVARLLALHERERLRQLVLINTEVPGHRPPWIPLYGKLLSMPGSPWIVQRLLRSKTFLYSSAGFGGSFADQQLIDGEFFSYFVEPLIQSRRRVLGYSRFLSGLDWAEVDGLAARHVAIRSPVMLLCGEADATFPLSVGRQLAAQLPNCVGFRSIQGAKLFPQEEKPAEVLRHLVGFLS